MKACQSDPLQSLLRLVETMEKAPVPPDQQRRFERLSRILEDAECHCLKARIANAESDGDNIRRIVG